MIDVETSLRDAFRQHETAVAVSDGMLRAAIDRARQRQRRRRLAAGGLVAVTVVVAGLISANVDRDGVDVATVGPGDGTVLDVGPVDRLAPGSTTVIETPAVFVLRTRDGALSAFSRRAPNEGCRLVLASSLDGMPFDDPVFFHDPCHGENFDRDGNHVGGPGLRGMYRYDVTVSSGRILVDTGLARPGSLKRGLEGGAMSLDRLGVTTPTAKRWGDALESAGTALQGPDKTGPFVWTLGAFEETATGVVTVDFTINGVIGELQIGPTGSLPDLEMPGSRDFDLATGTLRVWNAGSATPLTSSMRLADGQNLRFGLIPIVAPQVIEPNLDDLVTLIDQTVAKALR